MKHLNHTRWSATAIAAVLALSSTTPLAAQDAAAPAAEAPAVQPVEPPPPVAASPFPTIVIPDVTVPAASGAAAFEPAPEPSATVTTTTTKVTAAPATRKTHTVTRTVSQPAPAVIAPVAAVPPPANDIAPLPAETIDAAPVAAAPVAAAPEPTPARTENVTGTLGLILLGLLALAILTVGLLFFRRRNPVMAETIEEPLVTRPVAQPPLAEPVAATPMAAPTMLRRRDLNPVTGALASDGAAVDLPARAPESYQERSALIERMVEARPDRANPFTDRKPRLHRARLILQSLGTTFEREPRIDLSQYPNNWPELRQQYRKAA